MQHEASRWIAPEVQGSHVGPRTCHTSGRVLPMAFRAWVAAQRHMGFEMDPRELTERKGQQRSSGSRPGSRPIAISCFPPVTMRLDTQDRRGACGNFASASRRATAESRFVLFHGQSGASKQIATAPISRLRDCDPRRSMTSAWSTPRTSAPAEPEYSSAFAKGESVRLSGRR
jgi:alpha-galactosidase